VPILKKAAQILAALVTATVFAYAMRATVIAMADLHQPASILSGEKLVYKKGRLPYKMQQY
jgi:hypothetical protein